MDVSPVEVPPAPPSPTPPGPAPEVFAVEDGVFAGRSMELAGLQAMIECERSTRETALRRVENQVALAMRGMARLSAEVATASPSPILMDSASEARLTSSVRSALALEFSELQVAISDARAAVKEEAEQRAAGDRASAEGTRQVRQAVLHCVSGLEELGRKRRTPPEKVSPEGSHLTDLVEIHSSEERLGEKMRMTWEGIRRELGSEHDDFLFFSEHKNSEPTGQEPCTRNLAVCGTPPSLLRCHEDELADVTDITDVQPCQTTAVGQHVSGLDQDGAVPRQVMHKQVQACCNDRVSDVEYCTDDVIQMIMEHKAFVDGRLCDVQNDASQEHDAQEDRFNELQSAIIALTTCVSQIQDATGEMATFTAQAAAAGQLCLMPDRAPGHRQEVLLSPGAEAPMRVPVAGAAAERAESIAAAVASEGGINWSRLEPQAATLARVPSPSRRATSAEPLTRAKISPPCEPLTPVSENLQSQLGCQATSRGRSPLGREAETSGDIADDAVVATFAQPTRLISPIQAQATPRSLVRLGAPASPPVECLSSLSVPRIRQPLSGSAACPPGDSLSSVLSGVPSLCSTPTFTQSGSRLGHLWPTALRAATGSASLPLGGNSVRQGSLHEEIPQGVASLPARSGHGSPTPPFAQRATVRPRNATPKTALCMDRVSTGPAVALSSGSLRVGPGVAPSGQHPHIFSSTAMRSASPPPATPGYMTPRPMQYR